MMLFHDHKLATEVINMYYITGTALGHFKVSYPLESSLDLMLLNDFDIASCVDVSGLDTTSLVLDTAITGQFEHLHVRILSDGIA